MGRKKRCYAAATHTLAAIPILTGSAISALAAERMELATNDQVLQQWAQATGTPKPDVVPTDDGGYRVEWKTAVLNDLKRNTTTGNSLTTGTRPGDFNTFQFQQEYRGTDSQNNLAWINFALTNSNDRGVQTIPNVINIFQIGRVGEGYRVAAGDVPVNFSALGSGTALRGFYGEHIVGDFTFAGAAGVIANNWDNLVTPERRVQHMREAYALRALYPWSKTLSLFATAQSYEDSESSLNSARTLNQTTALAPAKGETVTAGFNWRSGEWSLSGEGGGSRWEEKGQDRQSDDAFLLDGAWQTGRYGLQVGHRDLGVHYTSLSGQAIPGLRETFGRANWFVTNWLGLTGDVRKTLNRRLSFAPPVVAPPGFPVDPTRVPAPAPLLVSMTSDTDSFMLGANVSVPAITGLALSLSRSESETDTGGGPTQNETMTANVSYTRSGWQFGIGVSLLDTESSPALFDANAETTTVTYSIGRNWSDQIAGTWAFGFNAGISDLKQQFDSGRETANMNLSLSLNGQHVTWGEGTVYLQTGKFRDPLVGTEYDMRGFRAEWGRRFLRSGSVKLYFAQSESAVKNQLIGYKDRSGGVQLFYQFGSQPSISGANQ